MAREAGPAGQKVVELEGPGGWASRAEQYSRTLGGQEGWTSRRETSTHVHNMFSTLITIPTNAAVCPHFIINLIFLWSILYLFRSLNCVFVPPSPSHKPEGIGLGPFLGALGTQC